MFVKGSPWYCDVPDVAQNKEKAKALLREAGYPTGLKVKMPTATTPGYFIKTAQIMQAQLKEVGIEIELEVNDLNTLMNRIIKKSLILW